MCHYLGGGLHGRQKRVKAQSESSKSVVNSVLISREMPVFPGFLEIIRVVICKDFDYQAFILQNLAEQEKKKCFSEHVAWIITYHTFCFERLYALQQFQFTQADDMLEVCCLGLGLEYEDNRRLWMQSAVEIWMEREAPPIIWQTGND